MHSFGFMQAQPFAIASQGLNLLARPMCFDYTASTSLLRIKASIRRSRRTGGTTVAGAAPGRRLAARADRHLTPRLTARLTARSRRPRPEDLQRTQRPCGSRRDSRRSII